MSRKEAMYSITPLGLISTTVEEEQARAVYDALELYMRRNGVGIALVGNRLTFVELEQKEGE